MTGDAYSQLTMDIFYLAMSFNDQFGAKIPNWCKYNLYTIQGICEITTVVGQFTNKQYISMRFNDPFGVHIVANWC